MYNINHVSKVYIKSVKGYVIGIILLINIKSNSIILGHTAITSKLSPAVTAMHNKAAKLQDQYSHLWYNLFLVQACTHHNSIKGST